MAPRRMDGFGGPARPPAPAQPAQRRPGTPRPASSVPRQASPVPRQPMPAPAPAPRPRPASAGYAQRPAAPAQYQQPPAQYQPAPVQRQAPPPKQAAAPAPKRKKGGGWLVFLQFVVGLLVIAGVAAAIVWLYLKYYAV